jgi:YD repeat-containing protein
MFLKRFLRRVFHDEARLREVIGKGMRRPRAGQPLRLELLEDRIVPSLLGLLAQMVPPDIMSNMNTTVFSRPEVQLDSQTLYHVHYDATPPEITLGDGSMHAISGPSSGGPAKVTVDFFVDANGNFVSGDPADGITGHDLTVTGQVALGSTTFDGTLITAAAEGFGSAVIRPGNTQFQVRSFVTGGLFAQEPSGILTVTNEMGLSGNLNGITISNFATPFTFTAQGEQCTSDLKKIRFVFPEPIPQPPLSQGQGGINACGCGCSSTSALGNSQDSGSNAMHLYDGESTVPPVVDLSDQSRGINFQLMRAYRSSMLTSGPLGHNWQFSYDRQVVAITADNLQEVQASFPSAKVGDVVRLDGLDRADLYLLNSDGSYTAPAGFFTRLVQNSDGTFTERDSSGDLVDYSQPGGDGIGHMTSLADREGNTMRFQYDGQGRLTEVIDTLGRPIQFIYDSNSRLIEVQDFDSRSVKSPTGVRSGRAPTFSREISVGALRRDGCVRRSSGLPF